METELVRDESDGVTGYIAKREGLFEIWRRERVQDGAHGNRHTMLASGIQTIEEARVKAKEFLS